MTMRLVYKKNLKTSAVSSTNFGSILVFASCVVGTCNAYVGEFFLNGRGPKYVCRLYCFSPLQMVGVGIL